MITTERLVLRPFGAQDLPEFVAYRSDPDVARYQSWDTTFSLADAERFLASQDGLELGGSEWLQLAAVDRATGVLCGDCAVRVADRTAELGVTLAPAHQGRGLAGEALAAVIERLFERLGLRCEARLVEADWFKGEWTTLRIYAILRREWQRR